MRTVAEKLKAALVTNETVTEVAHKLGMSRPALSNVVNGNAALSVELALKLEKRFGMNATRLLYAQLKEQIAKAEQDV
jgi:addiction module HigA family antidote